MLSVLPRFRKNAADNCMPTTLHVPSPARELQPYKSLSNAALTARIEAAAEACELWFDDHIIVEPGGTWSSMAHLGHIKRRAA